MNQQPSLPISAHKPIPILMYHQVDTPPARGTPFRSLVVAPSTFARHMRAMSWLGYTGLSMGGLEPYLRGEQSGKVFGITLDDGFENNLTHALPVLQRHGFSATVYAVADLLGQCNRWDLAQGVEQKPLMSAAQLQTWIDAGQEVGCHTATHADLPTLDAARLQAEIAHSRLKLESLLNQVGGVRHFCYPYGRLDERAVALVRASGYSTATTTVRARAKGMDDGTRLRLPRVLVSRNTTWAHLLLKCLTSYEDRRAA